MNIDIYYIYINTSELDVFEIHLFLHSVENIYLQFQKLFKSAVPLFWNFKV